MRNSNNEDRVYWYGVVHGAWDDGWFEPIGAYDWAATERFEIVPEHSDLKGVHFYFDDIRIVIPDLPGRH